ncbi:MULTISPECIES: type III secretion system inner membrane ring lipoprotein SctJ [Gluconobacter]|uniref:type III secretion system inner membrane ring lipoprotein SctJ n=1 Tax=Gluconobacter japonicus TaxID=376620 RepID=UPI00029A703D
MMGVRWVSASLLILCLGLTACQSELYTGLSERDAMQMVAILLQHGISADRVISKDGSSAIEVSSNRIADAVNVLKAAHYPRNEYASMDKVFQQQGLISSPAAERAKLYFGISQELDRTLNDIDGVVDARVHIAASASDPVTGVEKPATAAVVLRYDEGSSAGTLIPKIKQLVANAVQDLSYDRVSVILIPVQSQNIPLTPAGPGPLAVTGWVLAVFWPSLAGGWYLWRRFRGKRFTSRTTQVAVVSDRAA